MRRPDGGDRSAEGEVMFFALDLIEPLWHVLKFVIRIPVLLLRLLI